MARSDENAGFRCIHCGAAVQPVTNGSYRNHCPYCLWSLHVDDARPGDRASRCRAPMQPVHIRRNRKGFQIVHRCTRCGKHQANRVALDTVQDDFESLLALMTAGGEP